MCDSPDACPADDSLSSQSTESEYCVVEDPSQPRRSSVDSENIASAMSEVLAGLTDPSTEDWEFDEHDTGSGSEGRSTPTPEDAEEKGNKMAAVGRHTDRLSESDSDSVYDYHRETDFQHLKMMSRSEPNINRIRERHRSSQSALDTSLGHAYSMSNVQVSPKSAVADVRYTVFHGVTYLGAATLNAPRSEVEIKRNMAILNDHNTMAIPIRFLIPNSIDGQVRLLEPTNETEISSYKIHRILFCSRGHTESAERNCFAFTCSHGDSAETSMFQCHVFRCDLSDAVGKIMFGFQEAFNRANRKSLTSVPGMSDEYEDSLYTFDVSLDIKEEDGKGGFTSCPQDNGVFKLRRDVVKTLYLTLTQTSNKEVKVERCFGVLVSPGRNIRNSDMHLIEMTSMGYESTGKGYSVVAEWNPVSENFTVLNEETAKDMRVFMTVAVDLVFNCIREPIRFTLETRAKVYPKGERFFFHSKKPVKEKYYMHLTPAKLAESEQSAHCEQQYELKSLVSETVKERKKALNLKNYQINMQAGGIPSPNEDEEGSDDESPMVSGSGHVSKEITDADLLGQWAETLKKWHAHLSHRPKQVHMLCRKGVPEALRGEVWQLLSGCHQSAELVEAYRILITKDSPCTEAISRDMNRTFPAHEYFRDEGGIGQDSLYKLSKAYSVYDAEVGYCQGLSFLIAALLLHMPEEQAFSVLVKIMYDYHLRNFYKDGFQDLHLRFYQLERIFQNQLPDLYGHFIDIQLEAHMYASQWFLSMFTAKFPLYLVYRILDLFLCDGLNTVFSVALALLKDSRRELLALDFEGVLKFFRVTLPKKYRSEPAANSLLDIANRTKVSVKKLQKYEQEYLAIQAAQVKQEDPLTMYERDNKRLMETNMRLERENDSLAQELITSKVTLRNDLDSAEESMESLCKKLEKMSREFADSEEMVKRLSTENSQLKEKYRSEVCSVEEELKRNKEIIAQYKDICNSMSERNEKNISSYREELSKFKEVMTHCSQCTESLNITAPARPSVDQSAASKDKKIRELELELAQTKLALVQIECRSQEMSHELTNKHSELQSIKNNWWNKGLTTLREAVNKKGDAS